MGRYDEQKLQEAIATYLDHYPGVLWFHPANERKTSPAAGARLKRQGVKSGVPDIWILEPLHGYQGLVIELKTEAGRLTKDQAVWLQRLGNRGYRAVCCRGIDETIQEIVNYFAGNLRKP